MLLKASYIITPYNKA